MTIPSRGGVTVACPVTSGKTSKVRLFDIILDKNAVFDTAVIKDSFQLNLLV